ncbi:hypothetical protein [Leclercia adecarboxylata]|uniref:Eaa protein n=1 Tax=Leclercia adecarboxylata TaxID=83655 RepID=A0A4U9I3C4_9ENTR|nr:hypothetical protein [Leclercia adecarboxylata]KFC98290.1 hypothetical protein GLAD_00578 [Leclercia adecarboxylata ATCC 23216 = NBRC 102595]PHH04823.1 hypothetical protein CRX53_13075 [Leclercia adecarboxylata]UBH68571.1 hypothetical protein LA332_04745 [Leclercia adecarboxylata]SPX63806.1 Uncharacterised protein [Leclercia adecarboxylata]SPX63868.1 Uncharacterised protein [Leclercia adecarboxylata]
MSKFTKEQLIAHITSMIEVTKEVSTDALPDRYKIRALRDTATYEIALATLTAEPVAWDYEWASCITCEGPQSFKRVIEREAPPEWAIEEGQARNIIPLYPAPPVPAVPDNGRTEFEAWYGENCGLSGADLESEFNRNDDGEYIYSGAADAWKAWKASREVMIQGEKEVVPHETD